MFALFATAVPLSGILGAPLSGWIMGHFHEYGGLAGWKWLYIIEGAPSLLIGVLVIFLLTDRIAQAKWLSDDEKRCSRRDCAAMAAIRPNSMVRCWLF